MLATVGKSTVNSPRRPASWVKLCPGLRPPLCPICEITIRRWELSRKSLEVYATSRAWLASLSQELPIEERSPFGAVAAEYADKEAGPELFSLKSTGSAAVTLLEEYS